MLSREAVDVVYEDYTLEDRDAWYELRVNGSLPDYVDLPLWISQGRPKSGSGKIEVPNPPSSDDEIQKKVNSSLFLIALAMAVVGLLVIGFGSSWWAAAGVFLCMWADNISKHRDES